MVSNRQKKADRKSLKIVAILYIIVLGLCYLKQQTREKKQIIYNVKTEKNG